jgi:hypothetical protein
MKKNLRNNAYFIALKLLRGVKPLGRIDKGVKCSVSGCGKEAARSISAEKVSSSGLNISRDERRTYLCKEHYKEYKKKTKKDKMIDKWRYSA